MCGTLSSRINHAGMDKATWLLGDAFCNSVSAFMSMKRCISAQAEAMCRIINVHKNSKFRKCSGSFNDGLVSELTLLICLLDVPYFVWETFMHLLVSQRYNSVVQI